MNHRKKNTPVISLNLAMNNLSKEENDSLYIYLKKNISFFKNTNLKVLNELATKMVP